MLLRLGNGPDDTELVDSDLGKIAMSSKER